MLKLMREWSIAESDDMVQFPAPPDFTTCPAAVTEHYVRGVLSILGEHSHNPKPGRIYAHRYDLLLQHGQFFKPQPRPKGIRARKVGLCFRNAAELAINKPDLRYVEGIAISQGGFLGYPVHHGWCVDSKGSVIDNTWPQPGHVYFGVVFRRDELVWISNTSAMLDLSLDDPYPMSRDQRYALLTSRTT